MVWVRQPTTTHTVEYAAFAKWMNERFGQPRDLAMMRKSMQIYQWIGFFL